jgi:predicted ATPase
MVDKLLKRLIIKNFKAFKDLEIDIKPLTILVGPNSGGKSSIINSIKLIKQTLDEGSEGSEILQFNGLIEFGKFEDIVHQGSQTKEMRFRFEFEDNTYFDASIEKSHDGEIITTYFSCHNGEFGYTIEGVKKSANITKTDSSFIPMKFAFDSAKNENLFQGINPLLHRNNFFYTIGYYFEQMDQESLLEAVIHDYFLQYPTSNIRVEEIKNCYYKILNSYSDIKRKSDTFYENIKLKFRNIEYIEPIRYTANRSYKLTEENKVGYKGEYAVQFLSANDELLKRVAKIFNEDLDLAKGLIYSKSSDKETIELRIVTSITNSKTGVNFADVGCGTSQILPIIVQSLLVKENTLTIIEQPEAHLHPKLQADLGGFFVDSIKKIESKYIIETHSEYLIERIRTRIMKEPQLANKVAIYYIEQDEKSASSEKKEIKIDPNGEYSELPPNYLTNISIKEIDEQLDIMLSDRKLSS